MILQFFLLACGSTKGASRFIIENAERHDWKLTISPYVVVEMEHNLPGFPAFWTKEWNQLQLRLLVVPDVLTIPHPVVFEAAKDKPILLSAYSAADILLVMDKVDFSGVIADGFYGLKVMMTGSFLRMMREKKLLRIP